MSLLNDLDKTEMKNLFQGNNYKNTKKQYNNKHRILQFFSQLKESLENAAQENPEKGDFIKYDFQKLIFHGPIQGAGDYTKAVASLDAALVIAKNNPQVYAVEYEKSTKKAFFRTFAVSGELPKNSGKIPTMEASNAFITYLRPNNGMQEAEIGMNLSGSDAVMKLSNEEATQMMRLKTRYETLITQYETKYKEYLLLLTKRKNAQTDSLKSQLGKYDGKFYYINNFGVAREFTSEGYDKRPTECKGTENNITADQYSKLTFGPPMGIGEICRNGGFNAKNTSTGLISWVDSNGYRHKYSDWSDKHTECPSTTQDLTASQYLAMPKGPEWTNESECRLTDLDSPLHSQLVKINNDLMKLAEDMKELVDTSDERADAIDNDTAQKKIELKTLLKSIDTKRAKIKHTFQAVNSIKSDWESKTLQVEALQYRYLAWSICGVTFGFYCMKHIIALSNK